MPQPAHLPLAPDPRLAALQRSGLLDTPPEPAFDRLTRLASATLRAPTALVALVDEGRDFVKSQVGLPEPWASSRCITLAPTFCQTVVGREAELVVDDAMRRPEFSAFPAVGGLGVRAYLGVPLRSADGYVLGSLCVIDYVPRAWTAADRAVLTDLAAAATTEIALREEIAERGRADTALRRSEARLAEAQRVGRTGSWELDLASGAVHWSAELFRLAGLAPRDRAITLDEFYETVHPADRDRFRDTVAKHLASRTPYEMQYRAQHADGTVMHLCGRGEPVLDEDGALVRLLGTAQDLTERVLAEQAVRHGEGRFRALIENASDMISVLDAQGIFTYVSPTHARSLGFDADDLLGRSAFEHMHPDHMAETRAVFRQVLEAPRTPVAVRFRYRHKGGGFRTVATVAANLLDDPAIGGVVLNSRDITEQVELEDQLRQAQKMEAVGRLAGGVAHDFNNLLMVIGTHARFALEALAPTSPVREEIEAIDEAARRAATLTRQLLAFSRKQILKPEALDLNAVVRGLEPMLRRLIGEDIAVQTRLSPRLGMVMADPMQVEQVLVNLALNARDAMAAGGRLTIETADVAICPVTARAGLLEGDEPLPAGAYVRLTVRDTGTGMSAETQAHAFEPFFTTKETGKGTGLGLATVYGIVRQSGGAVRVVSVPGEGTTFEIDLPRAAARLVAANDGPESTATRHGTETVLLVEDEPQVRAIVRRLLTKGGYTVLEAADGHEALRMAADDAAPAIDLVVTDMVMPEMNGRDFADRLALRRPGARVLFMSGYTDDEIIRRGLLRPGMAFLEKPFSSDRLLAAVRAALEPHG